MKKIYWILVIVILATSVSYAQNLFEGSVKWSVKMEYLNPSIAEKKKQEIATLISPESMNQLLDMEQRIQDPVVRKHLDSNGFMRMQMNRNIQMRKFMQQHLGEDFLTASSPKAIHVKMNKKNYFIQMEGGAPYLYENTLRDSTGRKFTINEAEKIYAELPEEAVDGVALKSKIVKTKKSEKILNYQCRKYSIETELYGKPVSQEVWVTRKVKPFSAKLLSDLNPGNKGTGIDFTRIKGTPLKMILTNEETIVTLVVTELKQEKVSSELFVVPAGYKVYQFRMPLRK